MKEAEQPQEEEQDSFRDEMLGEVRAKKKEKQNEKLRELMAIDHQYLTATLDGLLSEYTQDLEQLHIPEKKIRRLEGRGTSGMGRGIHGSPFQLQQARNPTCAPNRTSFWPFGA